MGTGTIVTIIGAEVDAANAPLAEYEAVSESVPIGRVVVVTAAEPSVPNGPEPINVLPFKKLTAPGVTGFPAEVTVAVKVRLSP